MSASDYINLKRLKRTAGNNIQVNSGRLLDYDSIHNLQCIYKNNDVDEGKLFNYFNIVSNRDNDLDTCISNNYVAPQYSQSVVTKLPIIQQTPYIKNRTIQRKFCLPGGRPNLRGCVNTNAVILRVCGTGKTTIA